MIDEERKEAQLRAERERAAAAEAAAASEVSAAAASEQSTQVEPKDNSTLESPLRGKKMIVNGQEVDAEEYLRSRYNAIADEEIKRQVELERQKLERQKLGESIGEFSAVIGDMIKASNGAVVTPRDFNQRYSALNAQQRQLFDREMARREAARQAEAGRAEREKDRIQAQLNFNAKMAADQERARQAREDADKARRQAAEQAEADRKARLRIANITYGGRNKPEDEYLIDFGNGERKSYLNNTKEGRNAFASIYRLLSEEGIIPDDALGVDRNGEIIPVKTQKEADFLVREYLDIAMQDPHIKSQIYRIVMGKNKDFRDPLTRNIEDKGQQQSTQEGTRPVWQFPTQGGAQNNRTTSSGTLY